MSISCWSARTDGQAIATPPQVVLITDDPDRQAFHLPGMASVPFGASRGATKFDLSLRVGERADGIRLTAEYRTDLFDATTIDRMLAQYGTLLTSIVQDPGERISRLALMPPGEHVLVVETWNTTATDLPR